MKGRFRALLKHRVLNYHPANAAYIIYAACVLHNMAIEANLQLDENEIEYEIENRVFEENNLDLISKCFILKHIMHTNFLDNHYLNLGRNARALFVDRNFR